MLDHHSWYLPAKDSSATLFLKTIAIIEKATQFLDGIAAGWTKLINFSVYFHKRYLKMLHIQIMEECFILLINFIL